MIITAGLEEQTAKRRVNETFFFGLLAGVLFGVFFVSYPSLILRFENTLSNSSSFYSLAILTSFISFLVNPCLIFVIYYSWGTRRIVPYFRENYRRITILLFLGAASGYGITYFGWIFAHGALAIFATYSLGSLLQTALAFAEEFIVGGINLTLIGFAAIGLAYFRNYKNTAVALEPVQKGIPSL